jgi:hypothetical protein
MKPFSEFHRQLVRLFGFIKRDGLADVVHDHVAGVTAGQMLLELLAEAGFNVPIHIVVKQGHEFVAFHRV